MADKLLNSSTSQPGNVKALERVLKDPFSSCTIHVHRTLHAFSPTGVVYGLIRGCRAADQQLFTPMEASKRRSESSKPRSNPVAFAHIKLGLHSARQELFTA